MLGYASERLMQSIQLPSCLQSMTFGREVNQNLEGTQLLNCLNSLMFGYAVNRSLEGIHPAAQQPAESDVWRIVQSELGVRRITQQFACDFGRYFNQGSALCGG